MIGQGYVGLPVAMRANEVGFEASADKVKSLEAGQSYVEDIGRPGEALVLDMGEPVRIVDVAQRFANRHTPPLEIVFTGLRPGEKLHEVLLSTEEYDERPVHELISHVAVPPLSWECCQQTVARRLGERTIDAELLEDLSRAEPARSTAAAS